MTSRWIAAVLCSSAIFATGAFAQITPRAGGQTAVFDPQQLPALTGKVQQFTLTPRGDIDGFILADGTEVKTPPYLSTSVAYAVKGGDSVTIRGLRAAAIPLLQATSIIDHSSGRTIIDTSPG